MKMIFDAALRFDLDSNDMNFRDFIVAEDEGRIAGFGRLIERGNVTELGTIGVVEEFRKRDVASKIIKELIDRADKTKDLYLTTLIPEFFEKFGFVIIDTPPPQSMIRKIEYCEGCMKVGCTVMKLKKS